MWLEEFRVDGLRYDMTLYIRSVRGNGERRRRARRRLGPGPVDQRRDRRRASPARSPSPRTCAATSGDHRRRGARRRGLRRAVGRRLRPPDPRGGLSRRDDAHRHMATVRDALIHHYNGDAFQRVIYTESPRRGGQRQGAGAARDRTADDPADWYAQKRSTLGAGAGLHRARHPDAVPGAGVPAGRLVPRHRAAGLGPERGHSTASSGLYRDLIRLRLNATGTTRGLTGQHVNVHHINDDDKVSPSAAGTTAARATT